MQRILNRTIRAEGFSCTTVKDLYVAITSISSWYINQGNSQYAEQIEKMWESSYAIPIWSLTNDVYYKKTHTDITSCNYLGKMVLT